MDSYEAFFDEYVDFINQYNSNPSDMSLLSRYSSMLSREAQMIKEFEDWKSDCNTAELAYYTEVQGRIYGKLATVGQ